LPPDDPTQDFGTSRSLDGLFAGYFRNITAANVKALPYGPRALTISGDVPAPSLIHQEEAEGRLIAFTAAAAASAKQPILPAGNG
jgi:hypothetical protein